MIWHEKKEKRNGNQKKRAGEKRKLKLITYNIIFTYIYRHRQHTHIKIRITLIKYFNKKFNSCLRKTLQILCAFCKLNRFIKYVRSYFLLANAFVFLQKIYLPRTIPICYMTLFSLKFTNIQSERKLINKTARSKDTSRTQGS